MQQSCKSDRRSYAMPYPPDYRRFVARIILVAYCALAFGSHELHCWVGCYGGDCPPKTVNCPCGLPHSFESLPDEEVFTLDLAFGRQAPPDPLNDSCGEDGYCSICQYHAQGQLAATSRVHTEAQGPVRAILRTGTTGALTQRSFETLPRGPPRRYATI
jgi:hypothetical protein